LGAGEPCWLSFDVLRERTSGESEQDHLVEGLKE